MGDYEPLYYIKQRFRGPRLVNHASLDLNLLSNSIKFTLKGHIKVLVISVNEDEIQFMVEDTGIGMDEKE